MCKGELKRRSILFASKVNLTQGNPQIIMDEIGKTIGNFHNLVDEAKKEIEKKSYWDSWYVDDEEFRELVVPEKVWRKWFGDSS